MVLCLFINSNRSATWKSSNTKVATVTSKGKVTAKGIGTATITVTTKDGAKKTSCKVTVLKPLSQTGISLAKTSYVYSGSAFKPAVTVLDGTKKLVKNTDYTVKYSSNKNVGTATVTITGKGSYHGSVEKTFKILPKATTLSSVTAASKAFTAVWQKQTTQTTGYQLIYSPCLQRKISALMLMLTAARGKG